MPFREQKLVMLPLFQLFLGDLWEMGLVWHCSGKKWPMSSEFLNIILPKIKKHLTQNDHEAKLKWKTFFPPCKLLKGGADILGELIDEVSKLK